jgi:predicted GH43/DUF377 family glycosyl hydrolase
MKPYFTFLSLIFFYQASIFTSGFAQTNWTEYKKNPILDVGPPGYWDDRSVHAPTVIFDGNGYKMWYTGFDGSTDSIGYATSTDGIYWIKDTLNNPIIDVGLLGSWDDESVHSPTVIFDGNEYKMWFMGWDGSAWPEGNRIGYANSLDGIHWIKADSVNPVLNLGETGDWDDLTISGSSVLFDGSQYHMWYGGSDGNYYNIGYATSSDGIHWTKDTLNNPVLQNGLPGEWDELGVHTPNVLFDGSSYKMWYTGINTTMNHIGYATSNDGILWTKDEIKNPVLDPGLPERFDHIIGSPHVIFDGTSYKMWYSGFYSVHHHAQEGRIGYAKDFGQSLHSDSLSLNFNYTPPGSDTLKIKTRIVNPDNHTIIAKAQIGDSDLVVVDSTQLADEGDGIWGGNWVVPDGERIYSVGVKIVDVDSGSVHNGILWNPKHFTTIGPVVYGDSSSITKIFNTYSIRLFLRNEGLVATATNITAELIATDTVNVDKIVQAHVDALDIEAGQTVETEQFFVVYTTGALDIPFNIKIYSNGYHFWTEAINLNLTAIEKLDSNTPKEFTLHQNYPNPFNAKTVIRWQLAVGSDVDLSIFNLLGQKVATLVEKRQNAGTYQVEWDASGFASGVYLYRIKTDIGYIETKKLILLK